MSERAKKKNEAAVSAVAAVTAAGILLSSLFTTPGELVKKYDRINMPLSVSDTLISNDDDDEGENIGLTEDKQKSARASLRKRFLMLPVTLRALMGVPVWCIGRVVMAFFGAAWGSLIHPALLIALKYVCIAGLILAALLVTVKAVCPDVPVKKILDNRNVFSAVICTALFGLAGSMMQIFCPEGMKAYRVFESVIILAALTFAARKIASVSNNGKKKSTV